MKQAKEGQKIILRFIDPSYTTDCLDLDETKTLRPSIARVIGEVIWINKDNLIISSMDYYHSEHIGDREFKIVSVIPKKSVLDIKVLK